MSLKIAEAMLTTPQSGDSCPLQRDGDDTPYRFDPSALGGSGLPLQLPIQDGFYYTTYMGRELSSETDARTSDFLRAYPICFAETKTWTEIGVTIGATETNGKCRLGIYSDNGGLPGSLLVDAGEIDFDATEDKPLSISQSLTANTRYWAVIVYSFPDELETGFVIYLEPAHDFSGRETTLSVPYTGVGVSHSYGALPASFGEPEVFFDGTPEFIWLRTGV
jgi:hypothetical protein